MVRTNQRLKEMKLPPGYRDWTEVADEIRYDKPQTQHIDEDSRIYFNRLSSQHEGYLYSDIKLKAFEELNVLRLDATEFRQIRFAVESMPPQHGDALKLSRRVESLTDFNKNKNG